MKRLTFNTIYLFGMILAQVLILPVQSSELCSYVDSNGVRHYTDIHHRCRLNRQPTREIKIYSYVDNYGVRHYTDTHPSHHPTIKLYHKSTASSSGKVKIYRLIDEQGVIHLIDSLKNSPPKKPTTSSVTESIKTYRWVDAQGVIHLIDSPKDLHLK